MMVLVFSAVILKKRGTLSRLKNERVFLYVLCVYILIKSIIPYFKQHSIEHI